MKFLSLVKLFPLLLSVVACGGNLSSKTVVTVDSPEKDFGIEVLSGIPGTPYGPHPVRVYVVQGEDRDLLIRTPVFNDGKNLPRANAEVTFVREIDIC